MKKQAKTWATAFILLVLSVTANAQTGEKAPWVSDQGYWVVESNLNNPLEHSIRFYTNQDELLYTETVKNRKLNPEKRSTKMKLKMALESFMAVRQQNKNPLSSNDFVVSRLK